ncbi:Ribosomal biogenesis regulatory protein [Carpediemonas membranifera]|uniref:Ribosome biogenesis regulatory protein n=1 Tax=Carpediemonas membranifera TaxID=201153 RepID=A0A8J6B9C2_9EUKA|nr:Ribosomal biogenesis regulatory protein [Carpediemonas membranifera]|eukprot:KAG9395879.1 Ribosomal biogenesis regulatory protein [Carpediemonas membranifera]
MDVSKILEANKKKLALPSPFPDKEDTLSYDLAIKAASDNMPVSIGTNFVDSMKTIKVLTRDNLQLLTNHIFDLPKDGSVFILPPRSEVLPRALAPPKPKKPTKWEKFAQEKGIKKRTRMERNVLDKSTGQFTPRFGMKAKRVEDDWLMVDKMNAKYEEGEDPFLVAKQGRKERVAENAKKAKQNTFRAERGTPAASKRKTDIMHSLSAAKLGTASQGLFDAKIANEPAQKSHKRRHFQENFSKGGQSAERDAQAKILGKVLKRTAKK